jgi:recombination DNA repair RAD52 pathway protein
MGFSAKQMQALQRGLSSRRIRTREANGRELSYIEGWYAISEANRIFGSMHGAVRLWILVVY